MINDYHENNTKVTYDQLINFCSEGEKVIVPYKDEINDLNYHIVQFKNWINKYENSGMTAGSLFCDLGVLIQEGKSLFVDVSNQLEVLSSSFKSYCICRMHYHGNMVGCDNCDDWFHYSCLSLTPSQVEGTDKYICFRCNLENNFSRCFHYISKIIKIWSNISSFDRDREIDKNKILKKITKVEILIKKKSEGLNIAEQSVKNGTMLPDSNIINGDLENTFTNPEMPKSTNEELDQLKEKFNNLSQQHQSLSNKYEFEKSKFSEISSLMSNISTIFSVESDKFLEESFVFDEINKIIEAIQDDILNLEDVFNIIQALHWMNFCVCCLAAFRNPPTIKLLSYLVKYSKRIKHPIQDDKIIKFLNNMLIKSMTWKLKAKKKMLDAKSSNLDSQKDMTSNFIQIDAFKLVNIYQEYSNLPITSKTKLFFKDSLDRFYSNLSSTDLASANNLMKLFQNQEEIPEDEKSKKKKKSDFDINNTFIRFDLDDFSASDDDNEDDIFSPENHISISKVKSDIEKLIACQSDIVADKSIPYEKDPFELWCFKKSII